MFAIPNNIKLFSYGAAIIAVFGAGLYVRGQWDESRLESKLRAQETELKAACEKDKAITKGIDDELQSKVTDLSKRVAEYRRLHKKSACLRVTNSASSDDGKAGGGLVGANDIDSESLTSYAELAEGYRLKLVSCQDFIRLERR